MMVEVVNKLVREIYLKFKRSFELRKYDDFSIEEFFRKQGASVGVNNRILVRSLGESPFLIEIGNHCTIAPSVVFLTHDGGAWIFTEEMPSLQKFGKIQILDNCFIGLGATILPNVSIGPNSIVGARSLVTKNVSPNTVVGGNPAKVICSIDIYKEKLLKLWERQKPSGYFSEFKDGMKYSAKDIENAKKRDNALLKEHLTELFQKDGHR